MKSLLTLIVVLFGGLGAHADTYNCTSVGELLPENRLIFKAELNQGLLNSISGGTYSYMGAESESKIMNSGSFKCDSISAEDRAKGASQECRLQNQDSEILRIVIHPLLGLTIEIRGQSHLLLTSCK